MVEVLDIDDIKKLLSVFDYHLVESSKCHGVYKIHDKDGKTVCWNSAHDAEFYNEDELGLILSMSNVFFVYDYSENPVCSGIKKNIYNGKSPHEMLVAYDLMSCSNG